MTGPKRRPHGARPRRCSRNNPSSTAQVSGTTTGRKAGAAVSSPSTALRTEIDGVIMPSPYNSPAPNITSNAGHGSRPDRCARSGRSASNAKMPPSPWLLARMITVRYLSDTTSMSAQITSDRTPSTFSGVGRTPCSPTRHSRTA